MYLIQTVANARPRAWSSYTDVNVKDEQRIKSMNSVEEISTYRNKFIQPYSHNTVKTAATTYDFPEHPPKKDKKWTFGNLFRRKKKDESESSSEDETQKKNFLNKKKRKPDKRKKVPKAVGAFDHIVVPTQNRASYIIPNGYNIHEDSGILSDPSGGFGSYIGRPLPRIPITTEQNKPNLTRNETHHSHNSLGSADSIGKRSRKERNKLRAVARRDSVKQGSSSDEDSQRSYSSSKFRSDDSLTRQRDNSLNRRSRAARTDRHIRRLSKDDESILNREAMLRQAQENWHLKLPEDRPNYGRSSSRSPIVNNKAPACNVNISNNMPSVQQQSYSGLFTIPPSHNNHIKYSRSNSSQLNSNNSNSLPTKEYQMEMQNYITNNLAQQLPTYNNNRSLSLEANMHKSSSPENPVVMHVQLPLGKPNPRHRNLSLIEQPRLMYKQPPPPPPRDPRRVLQPVDNRPTSYTYDHAVQMRNNPISSSVRVSNSNRSFEISNQWHPGYRTVSQDQLPTESKNIILAPRPSSVTNETRNKRFMNRHTQESSEHLQYLTEKKPRSRKPIFIQSTDKINTASFNQNKAEPQSLPKNPQSSQKALNFWKQKDKQDIIVDERKVQLDDRKSRKSSSPQMFTSQTHVRTNIFLPSVLKTDIDSEDVGTDTVDCIKRESSPFKPISPSLNESIANADINGSVDSLANEFGTEVKRKSTNLEDALDELEAIYKSLRLGDEDLLERAEEREMSIYTKKLLDSKAESYPTWGISRGAMSDSSFSYDPFDTVDTSKRKKQKSQTLDRKNDDMAYRRMSKERANSLNNPQSAIANVSYLLASPVHCPPDEVDGFMEDESNNEPDITLDDVVYRAIKHANNTLKVTEPQPFGIPLGPISPAPNSDYLHATPENSLRYMFTPKKIPDIVKDDLAFRNLRKDSNKEPALKPGNPDDLVNNNNLDSLKDINAIKKKRAVRSLSANISNLIHRDADNPFKNYEDENENNKTNLTDIADAMDIARQILKEKAIKNSATKRGFLSDSETKYRKHGLVSASSTETITESRLNFLNEMRSKEPREMDGDKSPFLGDTFLHYKPPRGSTPDRRFAKESTPTPSSPTEYMKKDSHNSSFEDLLTALAVEARETSDRITNELKILDDDLNKKNECSNVQINEHKTAELNKKLSEIDAVSEHAKLCEKLLECVVESTELIASTKTESTPIEQVEQIEHLIPESVANIVTTRIVEDTNTLNAVEEVHSASEHDYENMGSDPEFDKAIPLIDDGSDVEVSCKSPFEEHRAELIASFKELDKLEDSFKAIESSTDEEKLFIDEIGDDTRDKSGGEECDLKVAALSVEKECAFITKTEINTSNNRAIYTTNCDIFVSDSNGDHESQQSSGFHSNSSCNNSVEDSNSIRDSNSVTDINSVIEDNSLSNDVADERSFEYNYFNNNNDFDIEQIPSLLLESLKSPKLVTSAMKRTDARSNQITEQSEIRKETMNDSVVECRPSSSGISRNPGNDSRVSGHTLDKTRSWYGDPIVLAFACSYGVACSCQIISLDVIAILGLLFIVISIAVALILE